MGGASTRARRPPTPSAKPASILDAGQHAPAAHRERQSPESRVDFDAATELQLAASATHVPVRQAWLELRLEVPLAAATYKDRDGLRVTCARP